MSSSSAARARSARSPGRVPLANVGMILFLGSELMFFAGLFAMYFTLRAGEGAWPPAGVELDVLPPAFFTALLVASSATMQVAVTRMAAGRRLAMARWIGATILLGLAFLAGQLREWLTAGYQVSSNAYGSAFFTMTGFHALHVMGGIVLMLVVLGRAAAGAYTREDHAGVEVTGYYWHFVDGVWVAMFTTIFLVR